MGSLLKLYQAVASNLLVAESVVSNDVVNGLANKFALFVIKYLWQEELISPIAVKNAGLVKDGLIISKKPELVI